MIDSILIIFCELYGVEIVCLMLVASCCSIEIFNCVFSKSERIKKHLFSVECCCVLLKIISCAKCQWVKCCVVLWFFVFLCRKSVCMFFDYYILCVLLFSANTGLFEIFVSSFFSTFDDPRIKFHFSSWLPRDAHAAPPVRPAARPLARASAVRSKHFWN